MGQAMTEREIEAVLREVTDEEAAFYADTLRGDGGADSIQGGDGNEHFGIGLWIVRRNIESIGGRITAENRPQGGFRVRLRIPSV